MTRLARFVEIVPSRESCDGSRFKQNVICEDTAVAQVAAARSCVSLLPSGSSLSESLMRFTASLGSGSSYVTATSLPAPLVH